MTKMRFHGILRSKERLSFIRQSQRIVFSRDVTFNEDESSFEAKSDTTYVEIDLINDESCEEIVEDHPNTEPEDRVEDPTPRRSTRQ